MSKKTPPPFRKISEADLRQLCLKMISEKLDISIDRLLPSASLEHDFGADSLYLTELFMDIETNYDETEKGLGVEITDDEVIKLKNIGDTLDLIVQKVKAGDSTCYQLA